MGKQKEMRSMYKDDIDYALDEVAENPQQEPEAPCVAENITNTCGLKNLGKTCWFNSAIQCLTKTPKFLEQLVEICETNQPAQVLPGGKLLTNGFEIDIPSIKIKFASPGPLTTQLTATLSEMKTSTAEVYDPEKLLAVVTNEMGQFTVGEEHDSHEFLRCLLEVLTEENKFRLQMAISNSISSNEDNPELIGKFYFDQALQMNLSPTEKLFGGSLQNVLRCAECGNENCRDEFFFDFSLPIPTSEVGVSKKSEEPIFENITQKGKGKQKKKSNSKKNVSILVPEQQIKCSLEECLDQFFGDELLTDGNRLVCEECTKRDSSDTKIRTNTTIRQKISDPPKMLILHLKRFQFLQGSLKKIDHDVSFRGRIDIAKYCTQEYLDRSGHKAVMYCLYAVEEHCMLGDDGHYMSYRLDDDKKVEVANNNKNHLSIRRQWVRTNDSDVQYWSACEVLQSQAYILFYKKTTQ